jgi:DNA-binding FadR family transcriptional regulator
VPGEQFGGHLGGQVGGRLVQQDHEEIVTALRSRDADQATAAMRNHLARVSRHLLGTE